MTTFNVGTYRTRDGRVATVEYFIPNDLYSLLGDIDGVSEAWTVTGRYNIAEETGLDLIEEWTEPVSAPSRFNTIQEYSTRDGSFARLQSVDESGPYSLKGYVIAAGTRFPATWDSDGCFLSNSSNWDLMPSSVSLTPDPIIRNRGSLGMPSGASDGADSPGANSPGAKKFDAGKPDLSLLPLSALEAAAWGFMAGEKKYGRWNYLSGEGLSTGRLLAAALRHLLQWASGEEFDADTSERVGHPVSHLGCLLCNIMMLIELRRRGLGEDNRAPVPPSPKDAVAAERGG